MPSIRAIYSLDNLRYFSLRDPAIGPVTSGGRPYLKWLFVAGKAVIEQDQLLGIDLLEPGRQARQATRKLLASI